MSAVDLSTPRAIHVVGAGGAGMGAIASVLRSMGHQVSGSDLRDGPVVARLRAEGVPVAIGHDPDNLGDASLVAISSAIHPGNAEVRAAEARDVPVVRRSDILPAIASHRRTIAVAGTHGKTTTSSMLALVLREAGLNPSFIIGGDVNEIGTGAMWDAGEWFVLEADESDRTFLAIDAEVAVVTSIEPDHLEAYDGVPSALFDAFSEFLAAARHRVVCADDPVAHRVGAATGATTYGTSTDADFRMSDVSLRMPESAFDLHHGRTRLGRITLPTPGLHNARNAGCGRRSPGSSRVSLSRMRPARWPASGRGQAFRIPRRLRRRHLRRRLRPPAQRGLGGPRRGTHRSVAPGGVRLPTTPLQPGVVHRRRFRGLLHRRRPPGAHRDLPVGRGSPARCDLQDRARRGTRRPSVVRGDVVAPPRRGRRLAGVPAAPRRPLPDARRRGPDLGARRRDRAPRSHPRHPPRARIRACGGHP